MADGYIDLPGAGDVHWKAPVANASALPATNNLLGDARVAQDMGFVYVWNGSSWINNGGSGTVTSVALTAPNIFSVSGSPITGAGTLALALATQSANLVWAGPASGGAATPTFRALVTADLPAGAGSPLTTKGDIYGFSTVNARISVGTDGQLLSADSTQALGVKWIAAPTSGITQLTGDVTAGPGTGSQVATIAAGAVTNAKVSATAAIAFSKLAALTSAHILVGNGSNVATDVALSGDATLANTGALTIANNAVSNAKLAQMANFTIKGRFTAGTGNPEDLTAANVRSISVSNRTSFVFQPGGTDTYLTGGNVYTSWATLYADLILSQGQRTIFISDFFAAVTMPAGTYDLSGVTFSSLPSPTGSNPILFLADGVVWSKLPSVITGAIEVTSQSNSPIWTSPGLGDQEQFVLIVDFASYIDCSGTAEMFKVTGTGGNGDSLILLLGTGSEIRRVNYEVINLINNGTFFLFGGPAAILHPDVLRGDGSAFTIVEWGVGSFTVSNTQTNYAGLFLASLIDAALYHYYNNNVYGGLPGLNGVGDVQDALQVLAGGGSVVDRNAAANGGSHTISDFAKFCILDNSGTIATFTVTMGPNPYDGQEVVICAPFAITALTVTPNTGQSFFTGEPVTTLAANGRVRYLWQSTPAKWYRVG